MFYSDMFHVCPICITLGFYTCFGSECTESVAFPIASVVVGNAEPNVLILFGIYTIELTRRINCFYYMANNSKQYKHIKS